MTLWKKSADYNLKEAKKYKTSKPVVPYLMPYYMPTVKQGQTGDLQIENFSEDEMRDRLQYLYDNQASGAIIWASSEVKTAEGKKPVFDASQGWGKALFDFAKKYNSTPNCK